MQLATYYIPLWIILPIVAFMYGATLVVVWRSHRAVQKYLATNHELSSVRKEIFSVGKELSITTKQVINEWKISAKFILWPGNFNLSDIYCCSYLFGNLDCTHSEQIDTNYYRKELLLAYTCTSYDHSIVWVMCCARVFLESIRSYCNFEEINLL